MSLTVTVQKGHDFSSGNVTRAALNAGAVPTVAVTGSVGTSELGTNVVTATELADDAVTTSHILNVNVTEPKIADNAVSLDKLAHFGSKGAMLKIGDTAEADTVVPESLDCKGSGKILLGTGTDVLSLASSGGYIATSDTIAANTPESHVAIAPAGFTSPATEPATALLTVRDGSLPVSTLRTNKVGGENVPGVVTFNNSGVPTAFAVNEADKVLVSTTTGIALQTRYKIVDHGAWAAGNRWIRTAHGLGVRPTSIEFYLECITHDDGHQYAVGDRVYNPQDMHSTTNYGFTIQADATYVIVHSLTSGTGMEIAKKCGGNTSVIDAAGDPTGATHTGTDAGVFALETYAANFKAVTRVSI